VINSVIVYSVHVGTLGVVAEGNTDVAVVGTMERLLEIGMQYRNS
jgi:hypothetical protein